MLSARVPDLVVGELVPGLLAVGEDLPQHHAEAPHITLCGEPPIHDALWGHPANGQHRVTTHLQKRSSFLQQPSQGQLKGSELKVAPSQLVGEAEGSRVLHKIKMPPLNKSVLVYNLPLSLSCCS